MQRHIEYLFHHIESQERYCVNDPVGLEILDVIKKTSSDYIEELELGFTLFRAQRGCILREKKTSNGGSAWVAAPFSEQRMIPLAEKVSSSRVSPKGIPVLYVAENIETAVQEMRPVPNEILTVAEFKAKRPLNVCKIGYELENQARTKEEWFWSILGKTFSKPVIASENPVEYAPTQYIAELLRKKYDGIAYKSMFNNAWNYAFFNIDTFECQKPELRQINDFPSLTSNHLELIDECTTLESNYELKGTAAKMKTKSIIYDIERQPAM